MTRRTRFLLTHVAPTTLLLVAAVLPLVLGSHTLYLRDAFNTHLPSKWLQAEQMRQGRLPLIDPLRDGGQPFLGNPNTVPLYPDNLLYLAAPTFWAFNAHFWLHLLLAPWAVFWLARVWGLGRRAAWAAGCCYAASGFFLSSLNLYNLVAGLALAPALAAAALRSTTGGSPRRWLGVLGLIWALMLLGGDPMTAAAALALALAAAAARGGVRALARSPLWAALGLGTLAAAPQIVEFLRILPASFRGHWGYSPEAAGAASWNPLTALDWLVPFPFGGPDLAFWGQRFFGGDLPLFFSLYPGVAALALVAAAGRPRDAASRWAWGLVGVGLFLSLGSFNPVVGWLMALPGAGLLRLPVKLWLLVAVGAAMLCGSGFERAFARGERRPLRRGLWVLAALLAAIWLLLTLAPGPARSLLGALAPAGAGIEMLDHERLRWAGLSLIGLLVAGSCALLVRLGRGRAGAAGAALLAVHVATQLLLLRPLLGRDEIAVYRKPPELLASVPASARLVHAEPGGLFGPVRVTPGEFPDARLLWYQRRAFERLFPTAGRLWGRRYELTRSPEGLDSFLSRATAQTLPSLDDARRLRLLVASGVDHLLLHRPLDPAVGATARLVRDQGGGLYLYQLPGAGPEVLWAERLYRAPHLNAALSRLLDPSFDPLRAAVLPGDAVASTGGPGRVTVLASGPESLELRVEAEGPGALVVQRAHLPIWRAEVDGRRLPLVAANLFRLGLELPAGSHHVRLRVDRRPLAVSTGLALAAVAALCWLMARPRAGSRHRSRDDGAAQDGATDTIVTAPDR